MATAIEIITASATLLGALGSGEVLNAAESTDGLNALNDLLESWSTDRLFVYQIAKTVVTWPGATASRTVGASGQIAIPRPTRVEDSYVTSGTVSYPVKAITRTGYDNIELKTLQTQYPEYLYYDPGFPLGTLYLYPIPGSTIDLSLNYWLLLPSFTALPDVVTLPPGYSRAIKYNLAVELSGYFGVSVPPSVEVIAASSAAKIKRLNSPDIPSILEVGYSFGRPSFSIFRGY